MIQITSQMRILVVLEAVDGRKGIDSLARLCQEKPEADPFSGLLFVFRSRRGTAIRILVYDGQGFWLAQKRLSKGRFRRWPEGRSPRRWRGIWRRINRRCCWQRATRPPPRRRRRGGR